MQWNGPGRTGRLPAELDALADHNTWKAPAAPVDYSRAAELTAPETAPGKGGKQMKMIVHAVCPQGSAGLMEVYYPPEVKLGPRARLLLTFGRKRNRAIFQMWNEDREIVLNKVVASGLSSVKARELAVASGWHDPGAGKYAEHAPGLRGKHK